jgi:hypothetical protein
MLPHTFAKRRQPGNPTVQKPPEKEAASPDFWRRNPSTGRFEIPKTQPLIGHQYPFKLQISGGTPRKDSSSEERFASNFLSPAEETYMDKHLSVNFISEPKTSSIRFHVTRQSIQKALEHKIALTHSQAENLTVHSVVQTSVNAHLRLCGEHCHTCNFSCQ